MSNEEFENLFGNVPFENVRKINEYIDKNFISKQVIRDRIIKEQKRLDDSLDEFSKGKYTNKAIDVLKELLGE